MEDQDISKQVSLELARRDLGDIADLKKNEAFNRYFLRRLKQKRDEVWDKFKNDPVHVVSKDEREILRRLLLVYEELIGLMDVDGSSARTLLSRSV